MIVLACFNGQKHTRAVAGRGSCSRIRGCRQLAGIAQTLVSNMEACDPDGVILRVLR